MPNTVEDLSKLISDVYQKPGSVTRFYIEVGYPIRVFRLVKRNTLEMEDIALQTIMQNAILVEPAFEGSGWEQLARAIHALQEKNRYGFCWVVGSLNALRSWLREPFLTDNLLGLPIRYDSSLPTETLVLTGSAFRQAILRDVNFLVKLTMDVPDQVAPSNASFTFGVEHES